MPFRGPASTRPHRCGSHPLKRYLPCSDLVRIASSVVVGVMPLGSTLRWMMAGLPERLRLRKRLREILGALHREAEAAEHLRVAREIRVLQRGRRSRDRDIPAPDACGWCRTCRYRRRSTMTSGSSYCTAVMKS